MFPGKELRQARYRPALQVICAPGLRPIVMDLTHLERSSLQDTRLYVATGCGVLLEKVTGESGTKLQAFKIFPEPDLSGAQRPNDYIDGICLEMRL